MTEQELLADAYRRASIKMDAEHKRNKTRSSVDLGAFNRIWDDFDEEIAAIKLRFARRPGQPVTSVTVGNRVFNEMRTKCDD